MKIQKMPLMMMLFLTTLSSAALSNEPANHQETTKSENWDLKGLRLGATVDDVKALFPSAECKTESLDTGLVTCMDWKNSLAGGSAVVMVKLLDGDVVYINVGNINLEQASGAAAALTEKYGPATKVTRHKGQTSESDRENRIFKLANHYAWLNSPIALQVVPFMWTDRKRGVTYAAVVLKDETRHDNIWLTRYNGQGKKAGDI